MQNNRSTFILALILIALGGVALLQQSALIVLMLLGLLFLVRQFDNQAFDARLSEDEFEEIERSFEQNRQAQKEPVYRHALEAVERAGLDPDNVQVLAVDVGVIAFHEDNEQSCYRTWALPDNVNYLQPFVQLRVPTRAKGRIRFEILDGKEESVFIHEDYHNLDRGRNLISPAARLAIHDEREMFGKWQLRVSADGVLLAAHDFKFSEAANNDIRRHIGEDGEINTELRAAMAESRLPSMSLDDLLAYQEDDETRQQQM